MALIARTPGATDGGLDADGRGHHGDRPVSAVSRGARPRRPRTAPVSPDAELPRSGVDAPVPPGEQPASDRRDSSIESVLDLLADIAIEALSNDTD